MIKPLTCPMCGHVQSATPRDSGCNTKGDTCGGCGAGCGQLRCARCGHALVDPTQSVLARGWMKLVEHFAGAKL